MLGKNSKYEILHLKSTARNIKAAMRIANTYLWMYEKENRERWDQIGKTKIFT